VSIHISILVVDPYHPSSTCPAYHHTNTCYTSIHIRSHSWVSSVIHQVDCLHYKTTSYIQDYFLSQDYFKYIQDYKPTSCLLMLPHHSSRLLLLLLLRGLQLQQGSVQGPFQDPMDLHLQGHQFHWLQEAPLPELLLGPLVLLHKVLPDLGLLHRQVLHQLDTVLVVEQELLVVPLPYLTLLLDLSLDLQGGPQEACSLTPEDNLAHFPVQGSIFPMTCWLLSALLLDPFSLLPLSSLVVCQSRFAQVQTRQ